MKTSQAVAGLRALAQDNRLAVYRLLVQAGPQGLAVGELAERLRLPGATLTNHLNILRHAGLVRDERQGRVIRCRADYAQMNALLGFLTENCCAGDTDACAPSSACASSPATPKPRKRSTRP